MKWICAFSFAAFVVLYVASVVVTWLVAWGLGRRSAIRRHWKMLHRVGSRFAGEDQ